MDPDHAVKVALVRAVAASGMSREQVLDEVNELAELQRITITGGRAKRLEMSIWEKWLNPKERGHHPSSRALYVLCQALDDLSPLDALAECLGAKVIGPEEKKLLEMAQIDIKIAELQKRRRELRK